MVHREMIVSSLASHPARPGKLRVYIDDKYAFELSRKSILALKISEGEELTPERWRQLEIAAAREAAIGLLARRERSRAELKTALKRKGFETGIVESVLDTIEKEGFQSDARFASAWVGTRRRLSPRGKAALAYELKQKGIPDSEAADALSRYKSSDERAALRDLIDSRLTRWRDAKDNKEKTKHRLLGFLSRRGFAYEDIRAVLSRDFPEWM
jgi:regulatory protein